jgi:DNA-binding beta-propeller fold protein YncE
MRTPLSILLLMMFFVASIHPTTAQDDLTASFSDPDCFLSLDYPGEWEIFGAGSMVIIAKELEPASILFGDSELAPGQFAITIFALTTEEIGIGLNGDDEITATDVLQLITEDHIDTNNNKHLTPLNLGQDAVQLTGIEDGMEYIQLVSILDDDVVLIMVALTVEGEMTQYKNTIIAIAETVTYENVALATNFVEMNIPATIIGTNGVIWQQQQASSFFRPEEFGWLTKIAIASDDTIYVLDGVHKNIKVFSPNGTFLGAIINHNLSNGTQGMALAEDGTFWLTDRRNRAIYQMDTKGNLLFTIDVGEPGEGPGQFAPDSPDDIAIGPDGNLYIFDGQGEYSTNYYGIGRIQVFDTEGNYLREFPTTQPDSISHNDEVFIAIDSAGNIYAADSHEIIVFDNMGNVLRQRSLYYRGNQIFIYEIIVGPDDYLYVADAPGTIFKLNTNGNILTSFGEPIGPSPSREPFEPGEFGDIRGLGVLSDGSIVAASYNLDYSQVVRFSFDNQDN